MTYYTTLESPLQSLLLVSNGEALTGLYMNTSLQEAQGSETWICRDDIPPFEETKRQLTAYFEGRLKEFDLPLAPQGTAFQRLVWDALLRIPYGATLSYGELARRIGSPGASRAVGLANGRNPISIIVPCHRVIGANGKLTGYGGGLPNKEKLLTLEAWGQALGAP